MTERRKKQRFELRLGCEIVHVASGLRTRGWTKNVSASGVLFTSEERVNVGDSIDYSILFPRFRRSRRDMPLDCAGIVLREDPDGAVAACMERYRFTRVK